jgi:hypothetical protein
VIANRTAAFGIALEGRSIPNGGLGSGLIVQSSIQRGFYLALAAGGLIILLAIVRFALYRNKANSIV